MRMIIEVDKYLLHLGKEFKWLKRSDIDNIDSNCLYQEHKVCQRWYSPPNSAIGSIPKSK
jgi:hypothetical protein